MDFNFTPIENYPFLFPFRFSEDQEKLDLHINKLLQNLEEAWLPLEEQTSHTLEYLAAREKVFATVISEYHEDQRRQIISESLHQENSFNILALNTCLLDSIIQTAFHYTFADFKVLKEILDENLIQEQAFKTKSISQKKEKLKQNLTQIGNLDSYSEDQEQRQLQKYFQKIEDDLTSEITNYEARLIQLKTLIPQTKSCQLNQEKILEHLVIFARGGYGRAELSFASDRDLGYCLDTQQLNDGEAELTRQLIIHIEHLLRLAGIETAHQYFEIDEELTRFQEPAMIHTIPSILESRVLMGSRKLSSSLKRRFYQILPYEPFVLNQIQDYHQKTVPALNCMNLKEDHGGLRSLQIPLWLAAATFGIFPNQTADMLALLIQKNILSPRQAFKLCQSLEFINDLRNFSATAKEFHLDEEAIHRGFTESDLEPDVINDSMERLYLLKKPRFKSIDHFDRYRLQMVTQIQELSRIVLRRLMDRTIVRSFSSFQIVVHLGQQRIVDIHALEGLPQVPISLIFSDPASLLELFVYVGQSECDLSYDLKDQMAELIHNLTPDIISAHKTKIAERFTELMLTPFAANALSIMFEICEPIHDDNLPRTLIGCFIPETNKMHFLLRNLAFHQHPVCTHSLNTLDQAQKELNLLKIHYPELHDFLKPKHILALKWGVLFHDIGKIDPKTRHEISGTSMAIQALEGIGYDDPELFNLVSLLIAHHMTVVHLSRTSAYQDQALQSFFEIADRDMINVILLFICNIADYISVSDSNASSTKSLRNFFEETYRVFAEFRGASFAENSIDLIHAYLEKKKNDLETDTRIDLLIKRSLRDNMQTVLLDPLHKINLQERKKIASSEDQLFHLWRDLKLGSLDKQGTDKTTDKLIRTIRNAISNESLIELTKVYSSQINWFFTAFPNRFLLGSNPDLLAQNLTIFNQLDRPAIVSVMTNARGKLNGLLIYVHEKSQIHSRIAYTLSLKKINIESAKMNQMKFPGGQISYCYYFKVSSREKNDIIFPRELETAIRRNNPPALKIQPQTFLYNTRLQLEFLQDDEKGYIIKETKGKYQTDYPLWKDKRRDKTFFKRRNKNFVRVKITAEDAPLVYYKIVSAFDRVGVTIQQAVITTIGHQVMDTFYITPSDHEKLIQSDFEESLKFALMSPSEI